MKKIWILSIIIFPTIVFSQSDPTPKLYSNYEYVVVKGKVLTRAGNPVPNVKVNAFQSRNGQGVFGNVNTMENSGDTTSMPKVSWGRTNEKGEFELKGIPVPGGYFLEIKGVKGYKKVQYPLRIDAGSGDVIDYVVIYLDKFVKISSKTKKMLKKMNNYAEKGNLTKAAAIATKILKKEKNLADPYVILGNLEIQKKNYKEALDNFNKAIANEVDNPKIYYTAAQISFALKNIPKGINYLTSGAKAGLKKDLNYYQMLFKAYYMSGDKAKAKETLGEMLKNHKEFKNREQLKKMYDSMK
jgi:hypothetical protein